MKIRKIVLIAGCVLVLQANVFAQTKVLDVPVNTDTTALVKTPMALSGIMMACMQDKMDEMKKGGKTDQEIALLFSDKDQAQQVQEVCLCQHKDRVQDVLKEFEAIMAKYPEWRGKDLAMQEGGGTLMVSTSGMEQFKKKIQQCP